MLFFCCSYMFFQQFVFKLYLFFYLFTCIAELTKYSMLFIRCFCSHLAWKTRPKAPSPISLTYWILFLGYSRASSFEFSSRGTLWYMGFGWSRSSRSSDGRALSVGVVVTLLSCRKHMGLKDWKCKGMLQIFRLFFFHLFLFLHCFRRLKQPMIIIVRKTAVAIEVRTTTMTDIE